VAPKSDDDTRPTLGAPKTAASGRTNPYAVAKSSSVDQRSGASATSVRSHDRDHGKENDYRGDEDDEEDERNVRLSEEASEARTVEGASMIKTDDGAEVAESRVTSPPSAEQNEEQQEPTQPQIVPAALGVPEAAAFERPLQVVTRTDPSDLPDALSGAFVRALSADFQSTAARVDEVPDARTAFAIPWFSVPVVGEVGLDLRLIEQGVHAFFTRLTSLKGEGVSSGLTNGIAASWLTAVAAAALEIARARDKARRSSLGTDSSAVLGCTVAGEGE
jgi:hypothetical protein